MTTQQTPVSQADGHVEALPRVSQLATPTYHWHLAGSHFRDYHLLFDEHADQIVGSIDTLAERVRKVGGTTIRSIGHIRQLQRIPGVMAVERT